MAKRGRPKGSKNKTAAEKATEKKTTKGRGRPKGSKNKPKEEGSIVHDPKKRGRPKGSKNQPKEERSDTKPKRGRGRPKGSKNRVQKTVVEEQPKRKRGRPKGSKNKEASPTQKESVKKLNEEILKKKDKKPYPRPALDEILFKVPFVQDPLIGTPKEVQRELDNLAKYMRDNPDDPDSDKMFDRIHLYMHTYLVSVVMKKFPFIKGYQQVDIYQETLIALRFKAIPGFKLNKGMSFLNFSKLCIRRHLITILNQAKNGLKSKAMNVAISLESTPNNDDSDNRNTYANTIGDGKDTHDEEIAKNEAFGKTKDNLSNQLSEFERIVLEEYLSGSPYKEISTNISDKTGQRCGTKRVDNALLRIRKKATHLRKHSKLEDIPMFLNQKNVDDEE
jgi:DNA-directed RNA polymerase specialized sigma24 family protein